MTNICNNIRPHPPLSFFPRPRCGGTVGGDILRVQELPQARQGPRDAAQVFRSSLQACHELCDDARLPATVRVLRALHREGRHLAQLRVAGWTCGRRHQDHGRVLPVGALTEPRADKGIGELMVWSNKISESRKKIKITLDDVFVVESILHKARI